MTKKPSKTIIRLSVALLSLVWGSTWPVIQIGLRDAPPFLSAALRFVLAALCLAAYMRHKKRSFPVSAGFWKSSFSLALFMFIIPYAMVYWGGMYVSSGLSSVLFSSQALFAVLCAHYMLSGEKASPAKWAGLLTGTCGLILIFYTRFGITSGTGVLGMLGIVAGALSAAYGLVSLKKAGGSRDHMTELTAQISITALAFLLLSACFERFIGGLSSSAFWLSTAYLAVVGTALAFLLYYWLAGHASALLVSLSVYLTPVVALFLGRLFLGEYVGANDAAGAAVVIAGIVVAQGEARFGRRPSAAIMAEKVRVLSQVNGR